MGNTVDPDSSIQQEERAPLVTYADVAGRLELLLTHPALNEEQVNAGCHKAIEMGLAAVIVRPCDVDMAARILADSPIALATVAGFPHGSSNTATKLYEGRDLIRRGAKELNFVVNYSKMISRQFSHQETELEQIAESCEGAGVMLSVLFESSYFGEDHKVILTKMSKRVGAAFISTNNVADVALLKRIGRDFIKPKLTGANLDQFKAGYAAGAERFTSSSAILIAGQWKAELAAAAEATS